MATKQKYVITIGYQQLAFDDKEAAMKVYSLLMESVPVTTVYCDGEDKAPESLKDVMYVRDNDREIEMKRCDSTRFAVHLTEAEYKEKCKPQPTEVDGDARLIADQHVPAIEAPADSEDVTDVEFL